MGGFAPPLRFLYTTNTILLYKISRLVVKPKLGYPQKRSTTKR